jgi:hypothetical protein
MAISRQGGFSAKNLSVSFSKTRERYGTFLFFADC